MGVGVVVIKIADHILPYVAIRKVVPYPSVLSKRMCMCENCPPFAFLLLIFSMFETWGRPVARRIRDAYADAEVDMNASDSRGRYRGKEEKRIRGGAWFHTRCQTPRSMTVITV